VENFDPLAHWQHVYGSRAPTGLSWYQGTPALSLELIRHCHLEADDAIIDVGGGASMLVDCLVHNGFSRVAVLDVSGTALAISRSRIGEQSAGIEWIESDITAFEPAHDFRLWHDRALFHFLTEPADRRRYIEVLKRTLSPGGHLILASFAVGGPERCSGLPIVQYDGPKLLAELGDEFDLVEQRRENHVTPAGKAQQFAWFRCTREPGHRHV
jgi:SAM-dependent methyltransferase